MLRVLAASNRKVAHVQGGQSMMPHVPSGQSMMPVGESSPRHSEKSHESGYNTTDNLSPQQMRVGSASPPSSNQGMINYKFLTSESNLKALCIFSCFLIQPH